MDRQVVATLILSIFCVGCYDSFSTYSPDDQASESPNATISHIHTLYSSGLRDVNQDLIVEGIVTANDEFGNFFKSFIIQEDGYTIEVLDGLYDSYIRHPLGSKITLKLNGLCLDRYLGVLRTGLEAPATSSYSLDYLTAEAIVDLHLTVNGIEEQIAAQTRSIDELTADRAGELIEIENLTLHTEDGIERTWKDYALFRNSDLDSIWCYTSSYADFADQKIPQGTVSLTGILEYGSTDSYTNQFIIKLRGADDCKY
ncbi:MAG: DUF5689 domain-containing protein [Rikenellaceae bacterium]